ncbi:hypothetical protein SAMCFNEI73_Ch3550 [Sinorhizobium americanum]|uniref:Uncharacterized protein n=1 Tax=Sinorhizobium americanum TaxID=194963 RepID=A0A1L3LRU1_9HYPH|nr:hypothetical protein SAMCCGM7_Ch3448 [Sinorhizobium americanum CCGM7]APG92801.1 hypothetical protein SAMCFNEI73_Ch3550 [Sinorhizobium americanum]
MREVALAQRAGHGQCGLCAIERHARGISPNDPTLTGGT